MSFAELSTRAQVHRLRGLALRALEHYPIEVVRLRLLEHGFNTTFRVDAADGSKYALRIDVNRQKPIAALLAEMAWLDAIARDLDIRVPAPIATHADELFVRERFEPLDTELSIAVMTWLPGKDLGAPNEAAVRELGRMAARLHEHATSWTPPAGAEFPDVGAVLMDSPNHLRDEHPEVPAAHRELMLRTLDHVEPLFDAMLAADTRIPIHADLHSWNVKWLRGAMSVFDFDDAGISVPAHDLSIAAYYLLGDETGANRRALFEGYEEIRKLPPFTAEQFEAALAARTLILMNDILVSTNREILDWIPAFLSNTEIRFNQYLDSGVYRSKLPGTVAIG